MDNIFKEVENATTFNVADILKDIEGDNNVALDSEELLENDNQGVKTNEGAANDIKGQVEESKKNVTDQKKEGVNKDNIKGDNKAVSNSNEGDVDIDITKLEEIQEDLEQSKRLTKEHIETIKELIEQGILLPFDDDRPIEEYTKEDLVELIKANIEEVRESSSLDAIEEFLKNLPKELQFLNKYYITGGKDFTKVLKAFASYQDIKELTPGKDDELIVRLYLTHTKFGSEEEIEDEIKLLKDTNKLHDRAIKFKQKLDEIYDKIIEEQLKEQENLKKKKEELAKKYVDDVYKVVSKMEFPDDIKDDLISGLTLPNYKSLNGNSINKLGYLLEKYQFVEPRLDLVAEALFLLDKPDEYRKMLIEKGKKQAIQEMTRKLKTEQQAFKGGVSNDIPANDASAGRPLQKKTLRRNIFSR